MSRATLYGWGHTVPGVATVLSPSSDGEIEDSLKSSPQVIARGLGRSYGDAAQVSGGVVLCTRGLNRIGEIDDHGVVRVEAGVSLDELLRQSIPRGWFLGVTPGTRQVTVGGALAADVHGKNHHVDGSFARFVLEATLVTPTGTVTISPDENSELFWATMGAMGLTGVLSSVTLQLIEIETDRVLVDTERFTNLDDVMDAMASGDDLYRYSVAWVDCMSKGARLGRSILTRANHARRTDVSPGPLGAPSAPRLFVPGGVPGGLLNPTTVTAFNELWYRSAPRRETGKAQSITSFFHPLDGVRDWNRLYGRRGFVQYQFCVPAASADTVRRVVARLSSQRITSFLAVLKRFGPASPGPLSFPVAGWTLALDMPVGSPSLASTLDELDDLVLSGGGRIYFAKDARLSPDKVRAMYPRLDEFLALKDRIDPEHVLTSDLARRLALVGG